MRFIKALITLILFLMGLMFFTQNEAALSTPLVLRYDLYMEGWKWEGLNTPFYFVLLLSLAAGALLSTFFFLADKLRANVTIMGNRRAIRTLSKEIERLRKELAQKEALAASAQQPMLAETGTKEQTGIKAQTIITPAK